MKSIIKQLYTILLVTVACLTVAGCSDDFKSNLRLDGDVWVNSIKLDEYAGTIDYQNKTIVVGVPYDYDVTRMAVSESIFPKVLRRASLSVKQSTFLFPYL